MNNRWLIIICIVMSSLAIYVNSRILFPYTNDDAYISLRYARNWAAGLGPVYNPGEKVEGYSNFLWVLIETVLFKIGVDAVIPIKILGFILAIFTVIMLWLYSPISYEVSICAGALLLFNASFWIWSWSGLETPMFTFLLFLSISRFTRELHDGDCYPFSAVAFLLLSFTRPEGIMFGAMAGISLIIKRKQFEAKYKKLFAWFIIAWGGYFFYWISRYMYYGYPFPNSYYVKTGGGLLQYIQGLRYLNYFFWSEGYYPFFILSIIMYTWKFRLRSFHTHLLALFILVHALFIIFVGGDQFPFFRFMVPIVPVLYLFIVDHIALLIVHLGSNKNIRGFNNPFFLKSVIIACIITIAVTWWMENTLFQKNYWMKRGFVLARYQEKMLKEIFIPISKYLKREASKNDVIAVGWAGAVPYYTNLKTIDMLGINDEHIAHKELPWNERFYGHVKHDAEYVLSWSPEFIMMSLERKILTDNLPVHFVPDRKLLENKKFRDNYRFIMPSITGKDDLELAIFRKLEKGK